MKRIAIADIHLTAYKDDPIENDGLPYRLSTLIKVVRSICKYARQNKITNIDILGDLFNDKDIAYTDSLNSFKDILIEFDDLKFLILAGNHDMSNTGDFQTSLTSVFYGYSNVKTINKIEVIDSHILAVPWSNNLAHDLKTNTENCKIMISHFGLSEATLQSGISVITDIKMSDLRKYSLVLLGHYHKPQNLQNDFTNLYYVGNPIHINWNDKNEQKRFLIYDTETLEVKSIPINGFKQYREFIIKDIDFAETILNEANKLRRDGNHVRVRNLLDDSNQLSEILNKSNEHEDLIVITEKANDPTNRGISVSMSNLEKLNRFLEIKDIPNKEEYLKEIQNIFE